MAEIPVFNLSAVERLRDKLYEQVFLPRCFETLDGGGLERLAGETRRVLSGVSADTLFESLRQLAGQPLQPEALQRLAWQLAGNLPTLRQGLPLTPWAGQGAPEWVPLQVLQGWPDSVPERKTGRSRQGFLYTYQILAGPACPQTFTAFWSRELIKFAALRFGFSRFNGKYPYRNGVELVGLRFVAQLDPKLAGGSLAFREMDCPSGMLSWNRQHVLRRRMRIDPCPNGWTHPCSRCAVGYDECFAATHPKAYVLAFCQTCGQQSSFAPERSEVKCVNCLAIEKSGLTPKLIQQ